MAWRADDERSKDRGNLSIDFAEADWPSPSYRDTSSLGNWGGVAHKERKWGKRQARGGRTAPPAIGLSLLLIAAPAFDWKLPFRVTAWRLSIWRKFPPWKNLYLFRNCPPDSGNPSVSFSTIVRKNRLVIYSREKVFPRPIRGCRASLPLTSTARGIVRSRNGGDGWLFLLREQNLTKRKENFAWSCW